ncbi:MAG: DUF126 domain-containing protein [Methanocalculus sp. MSAO_Arc2]|uniref:DUF126 domain-containing protein n=1 Tax=Methanocalculus sp. MSAO_Arc2 TaxID=2293855 RepID=UPI000FF1954E|nr:MAG: DUF126 domain-containing protein [Methanocalculus sp. MSAO_Arc2]
MIIKGRSIAAGRATGELVVTDAPLSFLSGVDPETGMVIDTDHPLNGIKISGKVLAFPHGKGSTVGSYVMYALSRNGVAPAAIINAEAEAIIAVGAIIAKIPMIDRLEGGLSSLKSGVVVTVDGDAGELEIDDQAEL